MGSTSEHGVTSVERAPEEEAKLFIQQHSTAIQETLRAYVTRNNRKLNSVLAEAELVLMVWIREGVSISLPDLYQHFMIKPDAQQLPRESSRKRRQERTPMKKADREKKDKRGNDRGKGEG